MGWPWVRDPLRRRGILAVMALVLAVLSIWPRHYLASAEMMPDQSGSGLPSILSGGGGALASLGALIGSRQSIESDLTIARSQAVAEDAAGRLRQQGLLKAARASAGGGNTSAAAIGHLVNVEALSGSIVRVSVSDRDPGFAKAAVAAYVQAIRDRLAAISAGQSTLKKAVAADRMADASLSLARAQSALDQFRLANRLAEPQAELGAAVSLVTALQGKLQAAETELATLQTFATDENFQVQATRAQISALRDQLTKAQANASLGPGPTVGGMTPKISEYENLYRNEKYAEAEYEIYKRYLDTVTVELLSSNINMSVVQPPFVDPDRQFNVIYALAMVLVLAAGVVAEFYLARPPPGWSTQEAR
jgi:hypothetical protein